MIFKTELEKDRTLFKTNFQTNIIAGNDGKSAYEIWLENGNEGTEQDFLDSLKGKDGSSTDVTPLTQMIDQNTADIAEINTKIDIEGKLPYTNIASATTAIYQNMGAMNGRIIDLENAGSSASGADTVISTNGNSSNWSRTWESGFIEAGGAIYYPSSGEYVNFMNSFSDTNYFVTFSLIGMPTNYTSDYVPCYVSMKDTSGACFTSNYEADGYLLVWYACGY